jgi:hypothetical protein
MPNVHAKLDAGCLVAHVGCGTGLGGSSSPGVPDQQVRWLRPVRRFSARIPTPRPRTYWPYAGGQGKYGEKLNNLTKFVASSNLDDAPWGDLPAATVTRDPAATIEELKEQSGKDIWLWGSLKLMHSLLEAGVVDEVRMRSARRHAARERGIFEDWQDPLGVQPKCNRPTGG